MLRFPPPLLLPPPRPSLPTPFPCPPLCNLAVYGTLLVQREIGRRKRREFYSVYYFFYTTQPSTTHLFIDLSPSIYISIYTIHSSTLSPYIISSLSIIKTYLSIYADLSVLITYVSYVWIYLLYLSTHKACILLSYLYILFLRIVSISLSIWCKIACLVYLYNSIYLIYLLHGLVDSVPSYYS